MPRSPEPTSEPLLVVEDLRTQFDTPRGTLRAVDGVSFQLDAGQTLGVVGESGSGKSVLVKSIMNLLPRNARVAAGSTVRYRGRDVGALSPAEAQHFWGPEIAMIFQNPMTSLNPVKKIGVQVMESMRFHLGLSKSGARAVALDLLEQVGIPEPRRRMGQYPHELSGGMRQRVMIAIALSCQPRLLIADEPTTALDVTVQRQILDLLARLRDEMQMAMILISHDLGVVSGMADEVAVMYAGQFVETARAEELFGRVEHPYTEALLGSIPRFDRPSHTRLEAIEGRLPDMTAPPPGCRFAPRCRYARDTCHQVAPPLEPGTGHPVRCFFPLGDADPDRTTPAGRSADGQQVAV